MVFEVAAGPQAVIRAVDLEPATEPRTEVLGSDVAAGRPYDSAVVRRRLDRYEQALRGRGYYEARVAYTVDYRGVDAHIRVSVDRGPHVSVAFSGDPLPEADRARLVPIRAEGAADEDLLEDSVRGIENYLHTRGYRDAVADYRREETPEELTIRFTIARGPRYVVDRVDVRGQSALGIDTITPLIRLRPGDPFVAATLDDGVNAIRITYRERGFVRATVKGVVTTDAGTAASATERRVQVGVEIDEGVRTAIRSMTVTGNTVLTSDQLVALAAVSPGQAFTDTTIAAARDRIDLEYRNRGYENITIEPKATVVADGTEAEVVLRISEGQQVIVDHVIIIGNRRTSTATIERELLLSPGRPLGYTARIESQQRLTALGLFRRVTITDLQREGEARRDVVVRVEEAPPTTIGYGGGLEGGTRLRPTGPNGVAEEHVEFAPRGFFEVGRSNLWGKNRSLNLFTRASLKARDIVLSDSGLRLSSPAPGSGYGLNEYRVFGTYREPRVFGLPADMLVTGILDQAIRSSFNFRTREVRAELGGRPRPGYSVAGRYSFEHTQLFDQRFTENEKPLIDRVFPQVRLSKFANSVIRDTRDDVLDPNRGVFVLLDNQLAMRAIGSEVGFVRTFGQLFSYRRLPGRRRVVLATGIRLGAAHGFPRVVTATDAGGVVTTATVQDLPASERFFAGGDTTVRGFSLDRLGTSRTISATGFPTGGNGEIVVNAEVRVAALKGITAVGFLDAGNVFPRASDLRFTDLRPAAGFGLHYRSPVGPLRVELGFNLDPRELVPGHLERRTVLHVSLGQAF
jgi:outer membrane protein assembly complex protein YaeT